MFYYEGFVKLHDEGYSKTIFVNSYIPFDKLSNSYFYLKTNYKESWILLLVKALAKFLGSYDKLSECSFDQLCILLLGSRPAKLSSKNFDDVYEKKFPRIGIISEEE